MDNLIDQDPVICAIAISFNVKLGDGDAFDVDVGSPYAVVIALVVARAVADAEAVAGSLD